MVQPNHRQKIPSPTASITITANRNRKANPKRVRAISPDNSEGTFKFKDIKLYKEVTMKYYYPAQFTNEGEKGYSIIFPDLPCSTMGTNFDDAMKMAKDSLELMLYSYEVDGDEIPTPTDIRELEVPEDGFVSYVEADTLNYRKFYKSTKAVKKTLSIPEWLNEAATNRDVNFSAVLQKALKDEIGIY